MRSFPPLSGSRDGAKRQGLAGYPSASAAVYPLSLGGAGFLLIEIWDTERAVPAERLISAFVLALESCLFDGAPAASAALGAGVRCGLFAVGR